MTIEETFDYGTAMQLTRLRRFVEHIAGLKQDQEVDLDGYVFLADYEDSLRTLDALISEAREILTEIRS